MKEIFEIKDINQIYEILDSATYGTLALSKGVEPYSLPINFARVNNIIYLHGSKSGRKIRYLDVNKNVSFSVVKEASLIPSFFSSTNNLACKATQFFRSVIIDGVAEIVTEYNQKVVALSALMEKLQKKRGYIELTNPIYKKAIDATNIIKITPYQIRAKAKFGQNLDKKRFEMIIDNLEKRAAPLDLETIKLMRRYYGV